MFIWIGKDANEVERTESVKAGELLDFTHLHKYRYIKFYSAAVLGLSEY